MMGNKDYQKGRIGPENSLLDGLRAIDRAVTGIALVVDGGDRLAGILVDGDIRRALIGGANLGDAIERHMQRNFVTVGPETGRAEVLDLMQARSLEQIPVVDDNGRLVGLHTIHEVLGREERPNWAVIMAGGKGTRLRPITENLPKPMVPVAGRPILERIVLHLVSYGIRRIFLSVNYLANMIEDYFGDGSRFGCQIEYLREEQPLGTGGALSLLPEKPDHPILVMNGDLVMQTNFAGMLRFHSDGAYYATMGLRPYTHEIAFGCAEVEEDRIKSLVEKPVLERLVNAGVYVLSPGAVRNVPANIQYPITNLFESALKENNSCGAYLIEEDWMDIGQPRELREARGQR